MVVLAGIGETIDVADGEVVKWILTGNPVQARAPIACFETTLEAFAATMGIELAAGDD